MSTARHIRRAAAKRAGATALAAENSRAAALIEESAAMRVQLISLAALIRHHLPSVVDASATLAALAGQSGNPAMIAAADQLGDRLGRMMDHMQSLQQPMAGG